jgi:signal transduction histidine kinase
MPRSIARRVHWTVFTISLISLLVTMTVVFLANEDLERSMLAIDFQTERDFVLEHANRQMPLSWDTPNLKAFYEPSGMAGQHPLPAVFRGLPFPFSGEIEIEGKTLLVTLDAINGGRLYIAKDISLFERREQLFTQILATSGLGMIALTFVLARISSRRLVTPLRRLTEHIRATPVGQRMPRIPMNFQDLELHAITETFNRFLDELEAYVKREHSLLSLASHELRTPIAVILGALDVIEQRGQLSGDDRKTLQRVQRAAAEMGANTDVLLKLARRKERVEQTAMISLPDMTRELLEDLAIPAGTPSRVQLDVMTTAPIVADPVLVKMLLRNLIQNALQHTVGTIRIRLEAGWVEITDQGAGLPAAYQRILLNGTVPTAEMAALSGLGLFIVTLICERLGWRLDIPRSSAQGSTLCLRFSAPTPARSHDAPVTH